MPRGDLAPHDVLGGALELAAAYKFFPAGTIFLTVVDPGVGSLRRGLVAEVAEFRFVAPDNGVLSLVFQDARPRRVVELTERRYARPTVSRTFEGRDRFAPAAGWLARGIEPTAMGRPLTKWETLTIPGAVVADGRLIGEILRVDHFGNLVSNIDRKTFEQFRHDRPIEIAVGGRPIDRLVQTYAEVDPGAVCALFGSSDHLEIAINGGSAGERLGAGRGTSVRIDLGVTV